MVKAENRLSKVKGQGQGHPDGQLSRLEGIDAQPYTLLGRPSSQDSYGVAQTHGRWRGGMCV